MARMSRSQQKAMFSRKIPKRDLARLRQLDSRFSRLTQDERFERDGIKLRLSEQQNLRGVKVNLRTGILTHKQKP